MRLFFCKEIIMRKLALLAGTALLMAAPAFATGTPSVTVPNIPSSINEGISVGGGISSVSGGGVNQLGSESSLAGTQSATSVENGAFNTQSIGTDTTTQQAQLADGTWSPSSQDVVNTTTDESGNFSNTAQSSEAFGGETGGGTYSGTAVEGGIDATVSGVGPAGIGPILVNGPQLGNFGAY
jgi:hypothetical protein